MTTQAAVTLTRIHAAKLNVLCSCRIYVCFLLRLFSLVTLYILYSGYVLVIHMRRIDDFIEHHENHKENHAENKDTPHQKVINWPIILACS